MARVAPVMRWIPRVKIVIGHVSPADSRVLRHRSGALSDEPPRITDKEYANGRNRVR